MTKPIDPPPPSPASPGLRLVRPSIIWIVPCGAGRKDRLRGVKPRIDEVRRAPRSPVSEMRRAA